MASREGQVLVLSLHLHHTKKEAQACDSSVCNKFYSLLLTQLSISPGSAFSLRGISWQPFSSVLSQTYLRETSLHETEMICTTFFAPAVMPFSATSHLMSAHREASVMQQRALFKIKKVVPKPFPPFLGSYRTGLTQYVLCFNQLLPRANWLNPALPSGSRSVLLGLVSITSITGCIWESAEKNVNLIVDYLKHQLW